jgi:hypothetical protein
VAGVSPVLAHRTALAQRVRVPTSNRLPVRLHTAGFVDRLKIRTKPYI